MPKRSKILLWALTVCLCLIQAATALANPTPKPVPVIRQSVKPSKTSAPATVTPPCPVSAEAGGYGLEQIDSHITISYKASEGSGMGEYLFVLEGNEIPGSYGGSVYCSEGLTVYDAGSLEQVFSAELNTDCNSIYMGFHVADVNFDGYLDVLAAYSNESTFANYFYNAYLWDINEQTFMFNDSFTVICNATVDPDREVILSISELSAIYTYYGVYKYIDGVFVEEAQMFTSIGRETTVDGRNKCIFWEYWTLDGSFEPLSWFEFVEGEIPDGFDLIYGEGSYWDIYNPIWRSGDHFVCRPPGVDQTYVGRWHAMPFVADAFDERLWLMADGAFIYGCSQMDRLERLRYAAGRWSAADGVLTLTVTEEIRREGGEESDAAPISGGKELTGYSVICEALDKPYDIELDIGKVGYVVLSEGVYREGDFGRITITLGETVYYDFIDQTDLFDEYYAMKSDAANRTAR